MGQFFVVQGCVVHCRMVNSIPALYPLDVSCNNQPSMTTKTSPDIAKSPPVQNHRSSVNYNLLNAKGRCLYNDFSHRWSSCSTKCFIKRAMLTPTRRNNTVHWPLNQLQIVPGFCPPSESAGNEQHWRVLVHNVCHDSPWAGQKADFEDGRCWLPRLLPQGLPGWAGWMLWLAEHCLKQQATHMLLILQNCPRYPAHFVSKLLSLFYVACGTHLISFSLQP